MEGHIVVAGPTGNTGQLIVEELGRRGVPLVAMVRREAARRDLIARGVEAVMGDFDDPPSLVGALAGAAKAYLVSTPDETLIRRETAFIRAAEAAGVGHVVKCSASLAGLDAPSQNLRSHGAVEAVLTNSDLAHTILRPTGYMQTFTLFMWDSIQRAGAFSLPAGEGKLPLIDVRDVAAVAIKALTEPGHEGKTYELTGPELLDNYELAEILTRVLRRPVVYIPGTDRQLWMVMKILGVTPTPTEHVRVIYRLQRNHELEFLYPTLEELGIEATTYDRFLRDWLAGETGGGNSFHPPDSLLTKLFKLVMPIALRLRLRL